MSGHLPDRNKSFLSDARRVDRFLHVALGMTKHIFLNSALIGLLAVACQNEPTTTPVNSPDSPESPEGSPDESAATQQGDMAQPAGEPEQSMQVLPAVNVIAVELDCPEAAVFFPTASSELDQSDKEVLDQVAACLKGTASTEEVEITGAADPRGTEEFNQELSQERAKAVADYLKQQGVEDATFEIYARGEEGMEDMPRLWPVQRRAVVETEQ